ncbi:hypothetical protein [Bergeyella zoohelcum]|uniref:MORN repeat variant n=1 Tax=Bergeyella zoohelcum TaxID=1015 RepID=A0A380ZUR0_9FLAO|nr:hypothetical protein [Bergeyella zoohelcum]SUV52734.1 Uncharacterised protein [Bergeyella zoohelcum]
MNKHFKIINILMICFTINACNTQKNVNINKAMEQLFNYNFEKLDINNKELLATKSRYGTVEPAKFIVRLNSAYYNIRIETYGLLGVYYDQWLYPKKGWFKIYKEFYPNGNIRLKRIFNKTSNGDYGKMYEFNEQGKLIKITDFEEGWLTSFEEVTRIATKYAKKYNYKVETAFDGEINDDQLWKNEYVKIWRKEHEGKKYWLIGFNKAHFENSDDRKTERLVILIDDSTRQIVDKNHYFDWYNRYFKEPFEEK